MGIEDRGRIDLVAGSGAGRFRFGRFIADFLDRREGIAIVALHSKDGHADLAAVDQHGERYHCFAGTAVGQPDGTTEIHQSGAGTPRASCRGCWRIWRIMPCWFQTNVAPSSSARRMPGR